jgi:hypothetical protein
MSSGALPCPTVAPLLLATGSNLPLTATWTNVMLAATFIAMVMIAQGDKTEGDNTEFTLEFYLRSDG